MTKRLPPRARSTWFLLAFCAACSPATPTSQSPAAAQAATTTQPLMRGAYHTGTYRNVFLERGKSQAEIDAKLQQAYSTYFTATDPNRLFFEVGADQAFIKDILHDDIRSEGQSYGLMITLQMNDRAKFNKLWKFAFEKMRIRDPKHPNYRCFAWAVDPAGQICDENSAPDGEEYFAMALYFAHQRWGSAAGLGYDNYKLWADDLLDAMRNRPPISGPRVRRIDAGNDDGNPCTGKDTPFPVTSVALFDSATKMIRFNGTQGEDFTDPSYHLPAFYDLFAVFGPKADAAWWKEAATISRQFFARSMHPKTGLAPEYSNYDGSPHFVDWNPNSDKFAYDAWRVGGNVGMDFSWMRPEGTEESARADALIGFFHSQGPTNYRSLFHLDGSHGDGSHSTGLVAMNAVATLATSPALAKQSAEIVEDLWNVALPVGTYRYYDGLLYMFGLLHMSGQYRVYAPAP